MLHEFSIPVLEVGFEEGSRLNQKSSFDLVLGYETLLGVGISLDTGTW